MIKVIKPGKKQVYTIECPECFAEFTYEKDDITKDDLDNDKIVCPCCGNILAHELHKSVTLVDVSEKQKDDQLTTAVESTNPDIWEYLQKVRRGEIVDTSPWTYPNTGSWTLDCNKCPWKDSWKDLTQPYIGDTPCTWCQKRQFTSIATLRESTSTDSSHNTPDIKAYNNLNTHVASGATETK